MRQAMLFGLVAGTTIAGTASAYTFPSFNAAVTTSLNTTVLPAVPAGTWNYYKFSTNWSPTAGGPWSSEARAGIWDTGIPGYVAPFIAAQSGAATNGNPTTLRWGGTFPSALSGGELLEFDAVQTFGGSSAQWNNITIELLTSPEAPFTAGVAIGGAPTAIDLGVVGSVGDSFPIDTIGSGFDTELGLYNQAGALLANNDDIVTGNLQSRIAAGFYNATTNQIVGGFEEGTYYIALGGFNATFNASNFSVAPGTATGSYLLNLDGSQVASGSLAASTVQWFKFEIVPAPGAAALLGLGGLVAARRRR